VNPPEHPAPDRQSISHDELMALPILRYEGPICVVQSGEDLQHLAEDARHEHLVGFDTETRPSFKKGQNHPPSLVQIATAKMVYLIQIKRVDCAPVITAILNNTHIIKAGVSVAYDLAELGRLFPLQPANVVDLGEIARKNGLLQTGIRNLTGLFLHGRITKGARTSNWTKANLTESQRQYAATDAWISRELYLHFKQRGMIEAAAKADKSARAKSAPTHTPDNAH
jgi:ribonuclease D